jgi:hypothetical protein
MQCQSPAAAEQQSLRLLRSRWSLYILGENLSGGKTPVLVGQAVSPARPWQCLNTEEDCRITIQTVPI